tara:strand:- start:4747 stop:5613 length:867 start_codon:yes stop_codon:yes gene_type:complete
MKKVLVTGGAGFVGSNLIRYLVKNTNFEVTSLDNYFTGKVENHVRGAKYIKGSTQQIFEKVTHKPDIVYHFGEYSRVSTSFEDIEKVWNFNISGTNEVIKFCKEKESKLIYSASSTKFGDSGKNIFASPYALSKSSNTDLINSYRDWFGLNSAICYFYNVYGAGQISKGKYATVIGIFEEQYRLGLPLTVTSPGTQKRDFTHISDIVDGLFMLSRDDATGDGFCFGTGKSHSILEVAKLFTEKIDLIPPRPGERLNSSIDLSRSSSLGWKAKKQLVNYIKEIKTLNIQ